MSYRQTRVNWSFFPKRVVWFPRKNWTDLTKETNLLSFSLSLRRKGVKACQLSADTPSFLWFVKASLYPDTEASWTLILLLFSHSVVSDSLQPHGLQHARLPCPSLYLPELAQTHVHRVRDAIQSSCPLELLLSWFLSSLIPKLCYAYSVSHVWLFVALWTVACQVPLSMEFSRQEYWAGCHFLLQGKWFRPRDWNHISCISCIGRPILYH